MEGEHPGLFSSLLVGLLNCDLSFENISETGSLSGQQLLSVFGQVEFGDPHVGRVDGDLGHGSVDFVSLPPKPQNPKTPNPKASEKQEGLVVSLFH